MQLKFWLNWVNGRLGTGYQRMLLLTSFVPLPFDLYLLRFPKGSYLEWHLDPVPNGNKHWRINLILKKAKKGGEFLTLRPLDFSWRRLIVFRSDQNPHMVTEVEEGRSLILSLSLVRSFKTKGKKKKKN